MIREFVTAEDGADLTPGVVEPVGALTFAATPPLRHFAELDDDGRLRARCSVWVRSDAKGSPTNDGLIGHFAAADCDDDPAGIAVLDHACRFLSEQGCARAIGPLDGNTWHRYRFVTERGSEPPFFLEPDNPDSWPALFVRHGFAPLATYTSNLATDLANVDPRTPSRLEALQDDGVRFRTLRAEELEAELARLYDLSAVSFANNFLYSPIDARTFVEMYLPLRPYLVPELVHFAERDQILIGYAFGVPDLAAAQRPGSPRTFLVKTVAVDPRESGSGLGSVLVDLCQQAGRSLGFERAIHALMHETNRSRSISEKYGKTIRRYTLFAKDLLP